MTLIDNLVTFDSFCDNQEIYYKKSGDQLPLKKRGATEKPNE